MHLAGRRKGTASVAVLLVCAVTCIAAASPQSDLSIQAAFLPPLPRAGAVPRAAAPGAGVSAAAGRQGQPPLPVLRPRSKPFTLPAPRRPLPPTMARSTATRRGASNAAADERGDSGSSGGGLLLHAFTVIGKSTRWTVAGLVGVVLLVRRDAAVVTFTAGAILNALFGKALKRVIKEARPDGAVLEDPGMPSSHAMALFYMTAFLTKALCEGRGAGLPGWWPLGHTGTIALILLYVAVASSWRVHSGLHTPAQIAVGAGVGSAVGAGWRHLCYTELNARVVGVLSRYPGNQVPLPYLAGVMVVGALTVGSVERKIAKGMQRIVEKRRKRGKGG